MVTKLLPDKFCDYCQRYGHTRSDCPKRKREEEAMWRWYRNEDNWAVADEKPKQRERRGR